MNAQAFLVNFRHIASAPGGMKRLREIILHLAVAGRLVPGSQADGNAKDDVRAAESLKLSYRNKLGLRPMAVDRPPSESEGFFPVPDHWVWAHLGTVACYIQRGKGPTYDANGQTLVVSQKCIQWSGFDLSAARRISDLSLEEYGKERFLINGDVLWNSTGTGTAGRVVVYPGHQQQVVADSHVTIIRFTNFIPAYVRYFLASPIIQQRMEPGLANSLVTGTTNQVELPSTRVTELPVPCPPVREQRRIVAKLDELMALCDRLAAQLQQRQERFSVLSGACHTLLVETPTPANLNRIFDGLGDLSVGDLESTILSLAVRGKLVLQDPTDVPADQLLLRIKSTLGPDTARRKSRMASTVNSPALALPLGWAWARFPELGFFGRGKSKHRPRNDPALYSSGKYRLVQTGDVARAHGVISTHTGMYNEKGLAQSKLWPSGTLCITIAANIADSGILGFDACLPDSVVGFIPSDLLPSVRYFEYFMRTAKDEITKFAPATAQKNINLGILEQVCIPLPPAQEQRRIVAKVDQLLGLVASLAEQQRKRDGLAETFVKAVAASLTGTQMEERKKMKVPKTELISVLKVLTKPSAAENAPLAALLIKSKGELSAKSLWQQSGLTIGVFYQQLKMELAQGWIAPPEGAVMMDVEDT